MALDVGDWAIRLFYDAETKTIGLKTEQYVDSATGLRVKKHVITEEDGKTSTSGSVSAKSFFDFFDIDYTKKRTFPVEWDPESGMYIMKL